MVGITITNESAFEKIGTVDVKNPSYIEPLLKRNLLPPMKLTTGIKVNKYAIERIFNLCLNIVKSLLKGN